MASYTGRDWILRTVEVKDIPSTTTRKDIEQAFAEFGTVSRVGDFIKGSLGSRKSVNVTFADPETRNHVLDCIKVPLTLQCYGTSFETSLLVKRPNPSMAPYEGFEGFYEPKSYVSASTVIASKGVDNQSHISSSASQSQSRSYSSASNSASAHVLTLKLPRNRISNSTAHTATAVLSQTSASSLTSIDALPGNLSSKAHSRGSLEALVASAVDSALPTSTSAFGTTEANDNKFFSHHPPSHLRDKFLGYVPDHQPRLQLLGQHATPTKGLVAITAAPATHTSSDDHERSTVIPVNTASTPTTVRNSPKQPRSSISRHCFSGSPLEPLGYLHSELVPVRQDTNGHNAPSTSTAFSHSDRVVKKHPTVVKSTDFAEQTNSSCPPSMINTAISTIPELSSITPATNRGVTSVQISKKRYPSFLAADDDSSQEQTERPGKKARVENPGASKLPETRAPSHVFPTYSPSVLRKHALAPGSISGPVASIEPLSRASPSMHAVPARDRLSQKRSYGSLDDPLRDPRKRQRIIKQVSGYVGAGTSRDMRLHRAPKQHTSPTNEKPDAPERPAQTSQPGPGPLARRLPSPARFPLPPSISPPPEIARVRRAQRAPRSAPQVAQILQPATVRDMIMHQFFLRRAIIMYWGRCLLRAWTSLNPGSRILTIGMTLGHITFLLIGFFLCFLGHTLRTVLDPPPRRRTHFIRPGARSWHGDRGIEVPGGLVPAVRDGAFPREVVLRAGMEFAIMFLLLPLPTSYVIVAILAHAITNICNRWLSQQ